MNVIRLHPNAKLPTRGSPGAAGFDLYALGHATVAPGAHCVIPTGIAIEMPWGFYARVAPRSGLAVRKGINVHAGVIDPDYRGEVSVAVINHGANPWDIEPGDRIAQLILEYFWRGEAVEVHALSNTERGTGGFGSTGMK